MRGNVTHLHGTGVPVSAILEGPVYRPDHIDGPMISWAGAMHWLTWCERILLRLRWTTIDEIACRRWPRRAQARLALLSEEKKHNG